MSQTADQPTIALITYGGKIDDGGYAQYAYEGVQQIAEEHNFDVQVIETIDENELQESMEALLQTNCAVMVTIGLQAGELAEQYATKHPNTEFITINYTPAPEHANVNGLPVALADTRSLRETLAEHVRMRLEEGPLTTWQRARLWLVDWNPQAILVPVLAILSALVVGAFVIVGFDPQVWAAFGDGFGAGMRASWQSVSVAYMALFNGAIGNPAAITSAIGELLRTGDSTALIRSLAPLMESLRITTPYIFTGLSVALGFRCGLFNIGAEGQYFVGGLASVFVGYAVTGLPWLIHLPLAVLAGFAGGALWSAIAGFLKAQTGAHEVINTIMLNYIAFRLADYLLQVGGPMARPDENRPVSPEILPSAFLPQFFPNIPAMRVNMGLFLALLMVFAVWFLLFKTTIGFEIRTVGANPRAARTAGINVGWNFVLAMGLSGGLAGLAGAHDILGVTHFMPNAFSTGYGFDAIAIALLGKSHPVGVLLGALLFGFLRAGATQMQGVAQVPIDIIAVLQGLIIVFVAAPELVRLIFRLRVSDEAGETVLTRGWGGV